MRNQNKFWFILSNDNDCSVSLWLEHGSKFWNTLKKIKVEIDTIWLTRIPL